MRIGHQATAPAQAALARIGRTEDVDFSPSGKRLALAGFRNDYLLILGVETDGTFVALTSVLELESDQFKSPHGASWIDEDTLAVASRYGEIALFELPREHGDGRIAGKPVRTIGTDPAELIRTPGSIVATPIGLGLIELIACNNYAHYVTRHLLDGRDGYAPVASSIVVHEGLNIPDGIARSASGRWLAISNHESAAVLIFEDCPEGAEPRAVLRGLNFPHGLRFAGENAVLAADAGARFVNLFVSEGDWSGEYAPTERIQVMDEATFRIGDRCLCDRGPKGIALTPCGRLLAVTCQEQPLAFFDLQGVVDPRTANRPSSGDDRARATLLAHLASTRRAVGKTARALRAQHDRELQTMLRSRSWRLTAPLRRLRGALRRRTR